VFFGGKGGVGKTTCACAFALGAARNGRSTVIVSTDPAHSLGDALGRRLTSLVRPVRRRLDAVELDAPRAFARWLRQRHAAAADVLEHGTWLDREDIDALLELPIPGIDELVGLIEIDQLAHRRTRLRRAYDLVVVDTAPTGHTLRLLAAPEAVAAVAEALDAMQAEHHLVRERLARVVRPEAADRLIQEIASQAAAIGERLRDADSTTFKWVTLPETMSVAEAEDAVRALDRLDIRVDEVVVNRVLTDEGPCPVCDRRRGEEARAIARISRTMAKGRAVTTIRATAQEPTGMRALAGLARDMADGSGLMAHGCMRHGSMAAISISREPSAISHDSLGAISGAKLIFVGGKGGVGKTTVAATIALSLAQADRTRRVLLLSTDPAHSLADVFGVKMADRPRTLPDGPSNLFVREVDAAAALAMRRRALESALDDIASAVGAGVATDQSSELMQLAPPGIDELFGLLSVFESRGDYAIIVVDTAPTGHALRLLQMPNTARAWVQLLLRVLLKYRALVRPGVLASELVELSKSIREFQTLMHDSAATRVVVVTRAARLPLLESERLIAELRKLRLHVAAVVVNALTLAPGRCPRCRRTRAAEERELAALRRAAAGRGIIRTPLMAPAPRGVRALNRWARCWLA
jgi:arsenite-transporting ATPase